MGFSLHFQSVSASELRVQSLSCERAFLYLSQFVQYIIEIRKNRDIYSLGFVRSLSFSCSLSLSLFSVHVEIVDRVALGEWPYLRPAVNNQAHSEELGLLMQRCWAEEPTERPEFSHIKVFLRKQNRYCY